MFRVSAFSMNIATILSITEYLQCMRYALSHLNFITIYKQVASLPILQRMKVGLGWAM